MRPIDMNLMTAPDNSEQEKIELMRLCQQMEEVRDNIIEKLMKLNEMGEKSAQEHWFRFTECTTNLQNALNQLKQYH